MAKAELEAFIQRHKIAIDSVFVPWSQSRNKNEPNRSLNWSVTLIHDGYKVLTTNYSAGVGHCPSYRPMSRLTIYQEQLIIFETENGFRANRHYSSHVGPLRSYPPQRLLPDPCDVLYSLSIDAGVLDYNLFEDWATEFGYDPDSRKAEAIYRACLDIALRLRNRLGDTTLRELQDACQDY